MGLIVAIGVVIVLIIIAIMIMNVVKFRSLQKKWKLDLRTNNWMVNGTQGVMNSVNGGFPLTATMIKNNDKIVISFLYGSVSKKFNNDIDDVSVFLEASDFFYEGFTTLIVNGELVVEGDNYLILDELIKTNNGATPNSPISIKMISQEAGIMIKTDFTTIGYPI